MLVFIFPATTSAETTEFDEETQKVFDVMSHLDMQGHADHDFSTCSMQQLFFDEISEMFDEGMTGEEIIDMYVEEYGQSALREPGSDGSGMVAWLTPVLAFVVGVTIVGFGLKRFTDNRANQEEEIERADISEVEAEILKKTFDEERRKHF